MARRKRVRSLRCPTCRNLVERSSEHFPFCSDRCRVIDLGKWASNGYVIATPVTDPEELLDLENRRRREQAIHRENEEKIH